MNKKKDDFPPDSISTDEALGLVADAIVIGAKPLRQLTKEILRVEKKLRKAVDDDAWSIFLRLEELLNERASMQVEILLRWGLARGSRSHVR